MSLSIDIIRELLRNELPGENAHLQMSPLGRERSSDAIRKATNIKESAVALVLYRSESTIKSVLIQRTLYEGSHSGQVCLPGGKKEPFEKNLTETAQRECVEETGLSERHLSLIGELTPVYIPVSNYRVSPYVFEYQSTPEFSPDPREVAEILPFNIQDILQRENIKKTDIRVSRDQVLRDVPYFDIQKRVVWGATAVILNEFKTLCESHFKTL
ncbi:MAG: CoA pyrophosphatase [Brumimicrobium sp.]|nr:CoA pyrophosphatase [Brumimicrobium sp.]